MTKISPIDQREIVGRCENCGREFLTMPKDGHDHYWTYGKDARECGGRVTPQTQDVGLYV